MFKILKIGLSFLFLLAFAFSVQAANPLDVVINEIAWMGTAANSSDEWIELYNNTNQDINLEGWGLYEEGGETLIEALTGIIKTRSYYLIERTDDTTISDIAASQKPTGWEGHGLNNSGEHLQLLDTDSQIVDEVNCSKGWFTGEGKPDYKTMERKDTQDLGSDQNNWVTNNREILNGLDAEGNPINGTPGNENSLTISIVQPKTEEKQQETAQSVTYPSGILINEILSSPKGEDRLEEWIELKNINNEEVVLANWKIADTVGRTKTYIFPEETKIPAQGFLILPRPTTKITLNNDSDGLKLIQPNGNIIDTITYEKAPLGQSYNRTESEWVWSNNLTPGAENSLPQAKNKIGQMEGEVLTGALSQTFPEEFSEIKGLKDFLFVLPIALIIAFFSGILILILKKKMKSGSEIPS